MSASTTCINTTVKSISYQHCHLPTQNRYSIDRNKACSVSWSVSGTRLASGHVDRFGKIWAVDMSISSPSSSNCREVSSMHGHNGAVEYVRFSPSSNAVLCSTANDKTVRIWDARVGGSFNSSQSSSSSLKCVHKVELDVSASSLEWSLDGKSLLMTFGGRNVSVLDMSKMSSTSLKKDVATVSIDINEKVGKCCFSPCGNYIAASVQGSTHNEGVIKLISTKDFSSKSLSSAYKFVCHTAPIRSIQFSNCGSTFVTSSDDGLVGVWNTKNLICTGMITRLNDLKCVAISRDSKFVASCSSDPDIDIADSITGERVGLIPSQCGTDDIAWSPSNSMPALAYVAGPYKIPDNDGDDDRDRARRPPPPPPPVSVARLTFT